jgi:hypothetical protein
VCAKVGSASKCVSVKITGTAANDTGTQAGDLNMTISVEKFEGDYIVFVNSTGGPIEGATVTITYSDGTSENFTTNVFGKVNFVPKLKDFTVRALFGDESLEKDIEDLEAGQETGLTFWRILIDFLIVGLLIGFGIILDEKML